MVIISLSQFLHAVKMLLCSLANIAAVVVVFLPLNTGLMADMNLQNDILNLVEGSELNYSTEVELSSLLSMYACVTKNFSTSFDDLDLNASLSVGACVECDTDDIGRKCAHQFNSSLTKIAVKRLQNDTIQLMNFFQDSILLSDNGTKIICAYAAGSVVVPYGAIYLNVSYHRPNDRSNLLIPIIVSCSIIFFILVIVVLSCIILCAHALRVHNKKCKLINIIFNCNNNYYTCVCINLNGGSLHI